MARDDLAARFARVTRRLTDAERPVLDRHGLSMWQYIVLSQLAEDPRPHSSPWLRPSAMTRRG